MSQFGFRGSPTIQLGVSIASGSPSSSAAIVGSSPANSTTTTAVTSSVPVGARSGSPPGPPGQPGSGPPQGLRCCDTGRPLFTDPLSGQSVCSCQYDILSYQRLASGVGAAGIPALSMYSAPYGAESMAAYFPALSADQAPFYTSSAGGLELKEGLASGASWPYPSVYHPYDAAFAGYPFNGYGMDLNGARRKNATRETTSTLKAWLNEHKKNPYPTKGEKIMLAIITKMTLTQVSTWFANARRRLKKENKMTWEPRNRVEDEDNNNDDESGRKSAENGKDPDSKDSGTASSEDGDRPPHHRLELLERPCGVAMDTGSEWSESRADSGPDSPECLFERPQHLLHSAYHLHHPRSSSPPPAAPTAAKPRIWSLADMASKESDVHHMSPPVSTSAFYSGKLISPLANRGMHPLHPSVHPSYSRPHPDFYRSFYGSHFAGGSGDTSLLETYSRTFGAGNNASAGPLSSVLSKVAAAAAAASASAPSFASNGTLTLTPTVAAPGASSSSSSSSSVTDQQLATAGLHTTLSSPVEGNKA